MVDIRDVRRPRRIVTGLDEDGRSYFARVEDVEEIEYEFVLPGPPQAEGNGQAPAAGHQAAPAEAKAAPKVWGGDHGGFYRVWGSDRLPIPLPTDGQAPFFDSEPSADEAVRALNRATILPPPLGVRVGWSRHLKAGQPGPFHFTDSTDMLFIMAGQRGQILDDGEVILRAGDVLIQNGTTHSHESTVDDPTVLGYIVVDALRVGPHPPLERLHRVSEPLGGHRAGEKWEKTPLAPWTAPTKPPGTYEGEDRTPLAIQDIEAPRRVVTGTNEAGNSFFARVEACEPADAAYPGLDPAAGHKLWRIWQIDRLPDLAPNPGVNAPLDSRPTADETPEALRTAPLDPEPLGVNVSMVRVEPTAEAGPLHWRDVMDVIFVMSGELTLILDSGEEQDLRAGDVVVENGTSHAWHNRGDAAAMLGIASFSGVRFGATPANGAQVGGAAETRVP